MSPPLTNSDGEELATYRSFPPEFFSVAQAISSLSEEDTFTLDGFPTRAHALASRRAFYAFRLRLLDAPPDDSFARLTAAAITSIGIQLAQAPDGTWSMVFGLTPFVRAARRKFRTEPDTSPGRVIL